MTITAAGDNVPRGTAHSIVIVVVRGTNEISRIFKLPTVFKDEFIFQFGRSSKRCYNNYRKEWLIPCHSVFN